MGFLSFSFISFLRVHSAFSAVHVAINLQTPPHQIVQLNEVMQKRKSTHQTPPKKINRFFFVLFSNVAVGRFCLAWQFFLLFRARELIRHQSQAWSTLPNRVVVCAPHSSRDTAACVWRQEMKETSRHIWIRVNVSLLQSKTCTHRDEDKQGGSQNSKMIICTSNWFIYVCKKERLALPWIVWRVILPVPGSCCRFSIIALHSSSVSRACTYCASWASSESFARSKLLINSMQTGL